MTAPAFSSRLPNGTLASANPITRYCYDKDGLLVGTHRSRTSTTDPNSANASGNGSDGQCPNPFPSSDWQSEIRAYYASGDLLSVTDAKSGVTRYAYDALGRQRVVQDPDGRQTATVYDVAGQTVALLSTRTGN